MLRSPMAQCLAPLLRLGMSLNHSRHEGFPIQLGKSGTLKELPREVSHLIHLFSREKVSDEFAILHQEILQPERTPGALIGAILLNYR